MIAQWPRFFGPLPARRPNWLPVLKNTNFDSYYVANFFLFLCACQGQGRTATYLPDGDLSWATHPGKKTRVSKQKQRSEGAWLSPPRRWPPARQLFDQMSEREESTCIVECDRPPSHLNDGFRSSVFSEARRREGWPSIGWEFAVLHATDGCDHWHSFAPLCLLPSWDAASPACIGWRARSWSSPRAWRDKNTQSCCALSHSTSSGGDTRLQSVPTQLRLREATWGDFKCLSF